MCLQLNHSKHKVKAWEIICFDIEPDICFMKLANKISSLFFTTTIIIIPG